MPRIELAGGRATLLTGDRAISDVAMKQAECFVIAYRGNALYQGDEPFFVVTFPNVVWVVPAFAQAIQSFVASAATAAQQHRGIFRGTILKLPSTWRRRAFGLFPVFSEVALDAHPLSSLPHWQLEGPLDIASVHELGVG